MTYEMNTREIDDSQSEARLPISRKVFIGLSVSTLLAAAGATLGYIQLEGNRGTRALGLIELASLSDQDKQQLLHASTRIRLDRVCVRPKRIAAYEESTMPYPPIRWTTDMMCAVFDLADAANPSEPLFEAYEDGDAMTVPIAVDNGVRLAPSSDTAMTIIGVLARNDGEDMRAPEGYYLQLISASKSS